MYYLDMLRVVLPEWFALVKALALNSLLVYKSTKVFSNQLINGTINKKCEKYYTVLICQNSINGDSTCFAPNFINIKKLATNT